MSIAKYFTPGQDLDAMDRAPYQPAGEIRRSDEVIQKYGVPRFEIGADQEPPMVMTVILDGKPQQRRIAGFDRGSLFGRPRYATARAEPELQDGEIAHYTVGGDCHIVQGPH